MSTSTSQYLNKASEAVMEAALGEVPVFGELLSGLLGVFWPEESSPGNEWEAIKDQVNAAIANAISTEQYNNAHQVLNNVQSDFKNLNTAIEDGANTAQSYFTGLDDYFSNNIYLFQGRENSSDLPPPTAAGDIGLLALFAPFAQLHLVLLREGVLFGKEKMGFNDGAVQDCRDRLVGSSKAPGLLQVYQQYMLNTYRNGWTNGSDPLQANHDAPLSGGAAQLPTQGWLAFYNTLQATMSYAYYWPYLDPVRYPKGLQGLPAPLPPAPVQCYTGITGQGSSFTAAGMGIYDWSRQGRITRIGLWYGETRSGNTNGNPASQLLRVQAYYDELPAPALGPNYDMSYGNLFRNTDAGVTWPYSPTGLTDSPIVYHEIPVAADNPIEEVHVSYYYTVFALAFKFKDQSLISSSPQTPAPLRLPSTYSPTPVGGTRYLNQNVVFSVAQPAVTFDPATGSTSPAATPTPWALSSIVVNQFMGVTPGMVENYPDTTYNDEEQYAYVSGVYTAMLNPSGLIFGFRDPATYPAGPATYDVSGDVAWWPLQGAVTFAGVAWPLTIIITAVDTENLTVAGQFSISNPDQRTGYASSDGFPDDITGIWGGQLTGAIWRGTNAGDHPPAPLGDAYTAFTTGAAPLPFAITTMSCTDDASQWTNGYAGGYWCNAGSPVPPRQWVLEVASFGPQGMSGQCSFLGQTGSWLASTVGPITPAPKVNPAPAVTVRQA